MNVIIVGGGKVGAHLASLLQPRQHRVKVIEVRVEEVRHLHHDLPDGTVVAGSGTDPAILESAGIRDADVMAAVTGDDETNLVATSLARFEFGVPRTIARVKDPRHEWMFTEIMGVDVALSQASLMAHLIAEEMSLGSMMTLLKLSKGEFSLVEEKVHPAARAAGRKVADLVFPEECILAGVIRDGRLIIPHGSTVLRPGDEVLAVVHASRAEELASILGK
ncbi:MAG: NAD-binding protein [Syntrophobacteraceae bacterium]|jgi:trk system potassium uptake protein TrkA|nr:NAD-binding protein [Syntrophobacteraceae bacterium]